MLWEQFSVLWSLLLPFPLVSNSVGVRVGSIYVIEEWTMTMDNA